MAWRTDEVRVPETPRAGGRHLEMRREAAGALGFLFNLKSAQWRVCIREGCDVVNI